MLATNEQQDAEASGDSIHASDKPVPTPPWHVAQTRYSKQGTGEDLQAHQTEQQQDTEEQPKTNKGEEHKIMRL